MSIYMNNHRSSRATNSVSTAGRIGFVKLAICILRMVPNSASTECTFSSFGVIHTKRRNRLNAQKVHKQVMVHDNIMQAYQEAGVLPIRKKRKFGAEEPITVATTLPDASTDTDSESSLTAAAEGDPVNDNTGLNNQKPQLDIEPTFSAAIADSSHDPKASHSALNVEELIDDEELIEDEEGKAHNESSGENSEDESDFGDTDVDEDEEEYTDNEWDNFGGDAIRQHRAVSERAMMSIEAALHADRGPSTILVKTLCLFGSLSEMLVTCASAYPMSQLSSWILQYSPSTGNPYVSTTRVIACLVAIIGGVLRYQCYTHLGRHFTFELAILSDHRLVTSGPYTYLRHPSYTAASIALFGALAWHSLPGSYVSQLIIRVLGEKLAFQTVVSLWLIATCSGAYILDKRLDKEDSMMKSEFGEEWEVWASRVSSKLIPGLY
ncbi:hypothetical protein CPB83DRAFT_889983 [Crepidotus variabilis]|uniref:Protein-S-isoprenylcysteine O-methyltransferase n=1 Tax=Crepidotus variabilis TaxID=179855 RepID=A0A9P6EQQ5_9AGAR|nr:hypothetical protein CPB83DRAFT_889983 [Crepidotus variabilis]